MLQLVRTPEDLGKHRGIKGDTSAQHVKSSKVNKGVGGDDPRLHASREAGKAAVLAIEGDLARKGQELLAGGCSK